MTCPLLRWSNLSLKQSHCSCSKNGDSNHLCFRSHTCPHDQVLVGPSLQPSLTLGGKGIRVLHETEKDPEYSGTSQSPLMTSVKLNISICKTLLRMALPPQLKGS